ncbi:MAG: HTH domain-containing protein [Natrialbaceae archaeon]|nr:HTH domain-containing protein [Natrialbaceae archaeon]
MGDGMMMPPSADDGPGRLEVHLKVRAHFPSCVSDRLEQVVSRVEGLLEQGTIDAVDVSAWIRLYPDRPVLENNERETLQQYLDWASRHGYVLQPAFRCHESSSLVETTSRTAVEVPMVSLAVFEDDQLRCVVPYSNGDVVESVEEYLELLERGHIEPSLEPPAEDRQERQPIELSP